MGSNHDDCRATSTFALNARWQRVGVGRQKFCCVAATAATTAAEDRNVLGLRVPDRCRPARAKFRCASFKKKDVKTKEAKADLQLFQSTPAPFEAGDCDFSATASTKLLFQSAPAPFCAKPWRTWQMRAAGRILARIKAGREKTVDSAEVYRRNGL